jgi:hypothetical protein
MAATLAVRRARIGPFKRPTPGASAPAAGTGTGEDHGLLSHHLTEITIDN